MAVKTKLQGGMTPEQYQQQQAFKAIQQKAQKGEISWSQVGIENQKILDQYAAQGVQQYDPNNVPANQPAQYLTEAALPPSQPYVAGNAPKQIQPIVVGGGTLTSGTSLGPNGVTLGAGGNAIINGQQQYGPAAGGSTGAVNGNISTGNPQLDKFLNETWLPLMEAQFSSDPSQAFNSEAYKNIKASVDATWAPIFSKELSQVQQQYDIQTADLNSQKSEFEKKYGTSGQQGDILNRGLSDITSNRERTLQDQASQQQRIARSYSEAISDSQDALSARNLIRGGTRQRTEANLLAAKQQQESDLNTATGRSLEDLQKTQERLVSDTGFEQQQGAAKFGRSAEELQAAFDKQKQQIEGEKTLQYANEQQRLLGLGSSLYTNPSLYGLKFNQ